MRILVIDDDPILREIITKMLVSEGHTVSQAAGGRMGLAQLANGELVDLVLTDLRMPGVSGWDVVEAVRAGWPTLRVGIITGIPELLSTHPSQVDIVIPKPVRRHALRQALSRLCSPPLGHPAENSSRQS